MAPGSPATSAHAAPSAPRSARTPAPTGRATSRTRASPFSAPSDDPSRCPEWPQHLAGHADAPSASKPEKGDKPINEAYRKRRAVSLARQDGVLVNFAKRIGHHGTANFIESVRQRYNTPITEAYAVDLMSRAGYPQSGAKAEGR